MVIKDEKHNLDCISNLNFRQALSQTVCVMLKVINLVFSKKSLLIY